MSTEAEPRSEIEALQSEAAAGDHTANGTTEAAPNSPTAVDLEAAASNETDRLELESDNKSEASQANKRIPESEEGDDRKDEEGVEVKDEMKQESSRSSAADESQSHVDEEGQHGETNEETASNAAEPQQQSSIVPTPIAAITPTLRGTFDESTGIWAGEWAMSASDFEAGVRGQFEYKREKKLPDVDVGKPEMLPGQPQDIFVSGYFTLLEAGGKLKKITEKDILIRFSSSPDGTISAQGLGKNYLGNFSLSGMYEPETNKLHLDRTYLVKQAAAGAGASAQKSKKRGSSAVVPTTTPRAATRQTPRPTPKSAVSPEDLTWGSAATAGPAAAVSQRVRRAPSHLSIADDADVERNKRATLKMLPVVEKLMRLDKAGYFLVPVDIVALNIPHYPDIISHPMDLGTVKQGILSGQYESEDQVADHIKLTFENAMVFNPNINPVHQSAKVLLAQFESDWEQARSRRNFGGASSEKDKKRKSSGGNLPEEKRSKSKSSSGRNKYGGSYDSEDDDADDAYDTYATSKPSKSSRRSHEGGYAAAAAAPSAPENEELRLLRKQVEMMSQQLESLKAVTIQSQQLQMQQQIGTSPRVHPEVDYHHVHAPAAAPKRRAPPKPKQPKSHAAPAQASADMDDELGGGRSTQKIERPLSYQEKRALGQDINKLPGDKVQKVIDIIVENGNQMGGDGEEVEIDIEKLNNATLKALQRYVREVLRVEKKKAIREGVM